jgi:hypothetical protein
LTALVETPSQPLPVLARNFPSHPTANSSSQPLTTPPGYSFSDPLAPAELSFSYRFVSSTDTSTVPDLTPAKDDQPPSRTTVDPKIGLTNLAKLQIALHMRFIRTITKTVLMPADLSAIKMPDSETEKFDMYYSLVEQIVALEIEIGLPDATPFSGNQHSVHSVTKLPALTRLNFYLKQLAEPMIGDVPIACNFHKGPHPDLITEDTLYHLEKYRLWLKNAKDGLNFRIKGLRDDLTEQFKKSRDDVSYNPSGPI